MDMDRVLVVARLTEERKEYQTEHVERCQSSTGDPQPPEQKIGVGTGVGSLEDCVLAEESGESRDAGNRKSRDEHRPIGGRNFLSQAAHLHHVLLAAHGMD